MKKYFSMPRDAAMHAMGLAAVWAYLADRCLKQWCVVNLGVSFRKPLFGQDFLVVNRLYTQGLARVFAPGMLLVLLVCVAGYRYRTSRFVEKLGFALMVGGGVSNLTDRWAGSFRLHTLAIQYHEGRYFPFNLADTALWFGGLILLTCLGWDLWKTITKK